VDDHDRTIVNDAKNFPSMAVYMEMSSDGDFEFKYGNPELKTSTGKWIAFEFKKSLLRVGGPWSSTCGSDVVPDSAVGTIVPVLLGNPALLISDYLAAAQTLKDAFTGDAATVPTKVILPIFSPENEGSDGESTWTEGVENVADRLYAQHCDRDNVCSQKQYRGCYAAGRACPLDHTVCSIDKCELQRWRQIITAFQAAGNVEVLGLIETQKDGTMRSAAEINGDIAKYENKAPVDGYFYNEAGVGGKATIEALMAINAAQASKFTVFGIGTPLFEKAGYLTTAGAPDTWITLSDAADSMGVWTPFSWFPYEPAPTFGAIVHTTDAADVATKLTTLVDRGYGYVYLHSAAAFDTTSGHLATLVTELGKAATSKKRRLGDRALQGQDDGVTAIKWGCDDTLFHCAPVCLETVGVTTTTVAASKCADLTPPDECSCRCFYEAEWVCTEDGRVVCQARVSGEDEPLVVGDLVCASRGTPKPDLAAELRAAGSCPSTPVARGMRPAQKCLPETQTQAASEWALDQSIDLILNGAVHAGAALALLLAAELRSSN